MIRICFIRPLDDSQWVHLWDISLVDVARNTQEGLPSTFYLQPALLRDSILWVGYKSTGHR